MYTSCGIAHRVRILSHCVRVLSYAHPVRGFIIAPVSRFNGQAGRHQWPMRFSINNKVLVHGVLETNSERTGPRWDDETT